MLITQEAYNVGIAIVSNYNDNKKPFSNLSVSTIENIIDYAATENKLH